MCVKCLSVCVSVRDKCNIVETSFISNLIFLAFHYFRVLRVHSSFCVFTDKYSYSVDRLTRHNEFINKIIWVQKQKNYTIFDPRSLTSSSEVRKILGDIFLKAIFQGIVWSRVILQGGGRGGGGRGVFSCHDMFYLIHLRVENNE